MEYLLSWAQEKLFLSRGNSNCGRCSVNDEEVLRKWEDLILYINYDDDYLSFVLIHWQHWQNIVKLLSMSNEVYD